MRWAGRVARIVEEKKVVLAGIPKERNHSENQGVDGVMGIRIDLREIGWGCRMDSVGLV
jgi:hypothetical protein